MSELLLLVSAEVDIQAGYDRYETSREGRGDEFVQQIDLSLGLLESNPLMGGRYYQDFRRLLVRKFPFGIFYVPETRGIVVHAVLNLRMDPERIRHRLRRPNDA